MSLKNLRFMSKKEFSSNLKKKFFFKLQVLEREFFLMQNHLKILNSYILDIRTNKKFIKFYLNSIVFLKQNLWVKYFQLNKLRKTFFVLKNYYVLYKEKRTYKTKEILNHQRYVNFYRHSRKNKSLALLKTITKQLIYMHFLYTRNFTFRNNIVCHNTSSLFLKTHPYNIKTLFDKNYFLFNIKFYFNFIKLLKLIKFKAQARLFLQSQIYKNYLMISQQYNFILTKNFKYLQGLKYTFKARTSRNQFKHHFFSEEYKPKNKIRKSSPDSKNYSLKLYKFSRNIWRKKTSEIHSQVAASSFIPRILSLFKLLRWKKQKISNDIHYRLATELFAFKQSPIHLKHKIFLKVTSNFDRRYKQNKIFDARKKTRSLFKQYLSHSRRKKEQIIRKNIFATNTLQYRLPYRKEKKNSSLLLVKYKLKYVIQEFLKQYLKIYFKVKVVNSMCEFKNLKFYRFFFGTSKWKTFPEITLKKKRFETLTKPNFKNKQVSSLNKNLKSNLAQYIYLGFQNIHFLNLNQWKQKQMKKKRTSNIFLSRALRSERNFSKNEYLQSIFWKKYTLVKNKRKDNIYLNYLKNLKYKATQQKNILWQYQHLTQEKRMENFMKRTFPILSMFTKYLDAQILVDHIAKELEYTKQHWSVLSNINKILSLMPLQRLIAYRIGIFGRINSSKKARVLFLKKGKLPLQNFTKNINFGLAQSRARIGSFGVKMWIYF